MRCWICKYITRNAFTRSLIRDKMPTVGIEPEALARLAVAITQLTKRYGGIHFYRLKTERVSGAADRPGGPGKF